jgi:hypothetical protein
MIDDRQMVGLMEEVKQHGGLINVHATNGDMIDYLIAKHREEGKLSPLYHYLSQPEVTEAEAAERFVDMANYTGCPGYIVHLTCEGALNAVRNATRRNQKVFVETCIQYLILDASLYEKDFEGAKWVMSPPLRQPKDQDTLWAGINQGLVQVVATDHCPFKWEQKLMGKDDFSKIPNGHPAIENRMELLYSEGVHKGKISLNKYVEVACTNPAKIFGMFPRKGTLAPGSDADALRAIGLQGVQEEQMQDPPSRLWFLDFPARQMTASFPRDGAHVHDLPQPGDLTGSRERVPHGRRPFPLRNHRPLMTVGLNEGHGAAGQIGFAVRRNDRDRAVPAQLPENQHFPFIGVGRQLNLAIAVRANVGGQQRGLQAKGRPSAGVNGVVQADARQGPGGVLLDLGDSLDLQRVSLSGDGIREMHHDLRAGG